MKKITNSREFLVSELFEKFISVSKSGKRVQSNGKRLSQGTIENYEYTLNLLNKFCVARTFILRVKPIKYLTKREQTRERNYWKKFYASFTDYLYTDCGHFDNYVGLTIKNLRTFFNYCNKDLMLGIGDFHTSFYVRKEEVPILTLLPEELNFLIYDKALENRLTKKLNKVKDFFVFGCTVALRISDLFKLKQSNLRNLNNTFYLIVRSQKTGSDTFIRLPEYAVEIINKYKLKGGMLLPHFNKVNLNLYIKQLAETAGFTQPVIKARAKRGAEKVIRKTADKGNSEYRFCDLVSTHTMRRTAITTMLSLGVPEQIVRKISGHSPMSKEFFRYVSLAQSYQDIETAKMFERLSEKKLAG